MILRREVVKARITTHPEHLGLNRVTPLRLSLNKLEPAEDTFVEEEGFASCPRQIQIYSNPAQFTEHPHSFTLAPK
jgi:hypothetical protein